MKKWLVTALAVLNIGMLIRIWQVATNHLTYVKDGRYYLATTLFLLAVATVALFDWTSILRLDQSYFDPKPVIILGGVCSLLVIGALVVKPSVKPKKITMVSISVSQVQKNLQIMKKDTDTMADPVYFYTPNSHVAEIMQNLNNLSANGRFQTCNLSAARKKISAGQLAALKQRLKIKSANAVVFFEGGQHYKTYNHVQNAKQMELALGHYY